MLLGRIVDDDATWTSIRGTEEPVSIEYRVQVPIIDVKAIGDDIRIRGPVYVGDDSMLDRHNELVDASAILEAWESYSNNPVILYNHSKTYGVIGIMESVEEGDFETPDGRVLSVPIGTALIDGGEESIVRKINKGMLRAFSIGFIAKAGVKECPDEDSCYIKFTEIEWLETSVVDVPASPGALFSVEKSLVYNDGSKKSIAYDRQPLLSDFSKAACCDSGAATAGEICTCGITHDSHAHEEGEEHTMVAQIAELREMVANLRSLFKTDSLNTPLSQPEGQPTGDEAMSDTDIVTDDDLIDEVVADLEAEKAHVGGEGYPEDGKPVMPTRVVAEEPAPVEELAEEPAEVVEETPAPKSKPKKTKSDEAEESEEEESEEEESEEEEEELEEAEAEAEAAEDEEEEDLDEEDEEDDGATLEVVEESADLPTTVEVLMHVAKGLDGVTNSVMALEAKFDENAALKSALTEAEATIVTLTEQKAAAEQEKEIETEVSKRLAEVMTELGLSNNPQRKTLVESEAPKPEPTDVTRFDPQPTVTPGMNGLAQWLEARIGER